MSFSRIAGLTVAAAVTLGACSNPPERPAGEAERPVIEGTSGATLTVDSSVVFVDVRTQREYDAGHIDGAIHIPHTEMDERYEELERYKDQQIVVYCRSGRRSGIAEGILENHGFENVINGGGLQDLAARGVPTSPNCC